MIGRVLAPACIAVAMQAGGLEAQQVAAPRPVPGFTASATAKQRALEARFLAVPSASSARRTARELAQAPHLAGTPGGRAVAERLAGELRDLGFDVRMERYDVYLPHPREVRIDLVAPERRALRTREPLASGDEPGAEAPFWSWNAYAANGVVEAPVVYANYGLPEDFDALAALGVDVRGKIVLVRFGRSFRGVKVQVAEDRGAAGVILYSDPSGDGYAAGDTLPLGPFRPSQAVQRGTVEYLWRYTGDPLTPGLAALPGTPRLDPSEATNLPRIPVAPLPYGEAEWILRTLDGPVAPDAFQGGLPFGYRVGSGAARVRLEVDQAYALRPIWNVIATLHGREPRFVVLGNHHDAWIYGGVDPHSGTAALLEVARGLGALHDGGWSPRRGIVLAFWDAEEYGAIGSTEWVEHHLATLREQAVAYFNVDMFTAGTLDVSGSPSLRDLVVSAAEAVDDPLSGGSLADAWRERQRRRGVAGDATDPVLSDIGAGSDWTAFFHFAGVPSLQWTMNGRGAYGVYHSILDDAAYYERHADSAFVFTPAMARVMGVAALRLAEADALPFRYSHYADRIASYLAAREEAGAARAALAAMREAAIAVEAAQERALARGDTTALRSIDAGLAAVERALTDDRGMVDRPWYRHVVYAPGRHTGYDPLVLPGVAEAIESGDAAAVEREVGRLEAALARAAESLRRLVPASADGEATSGKGSEG